MWPGEDGRRSKLATRKMEVTNSDTSRHLYDYNFTIAKHLSILNSHNLSFYRR